METLSAMDIVKVLRNKQISLFTLADFGRLLNIANQQTLYKKLQRLEKEEIIEKLINGKYRFLFGTINVFTMANFLYQPSYISLESALSFHGIITGFPYQITSMSIKKPCRFEVDGRDFHYSQISPKLFWGYEKKENFAVANREKALLDYIYFGTKGLRNLSFDEFDLTGINKPKLAIYAKKFNNKIYDYIRTNRKFS